MAPSTIIELIATLAFTAYFPLITFSFFKFRLARKQEQLELLEEKIRLTGEYNNFSFKESIEKEFPVSDYLLPLLFITLVTFLGMYLAFLGWNLFEKIDTVRSVLWSGSQFWESDPEIATEKRNVAVVAYAVLGSFISSAQYVYRRYATVDLTPGNFFSVGIRMMLSAIVALMLSHLFAGQADADTIIGGEMLLAIAFLTGVFPDRGFRLLMEKVKLFSNDGNSSAKNFSLESIEGMSQLHRIRLGELGIDNVQNLAQYDFPLLIIKTPFPMRTLLDWAAQAKLIMEFQDSYSQLHAAGIRSVLDFWDACKDNPERVKEISELTGINVLTLEINFKNISKDNSVILLKHFREHGDHIKLGKD